MKITNDGYPVKIRFECKEKLPKFKYGCKVRTKLLREQLEGKKKIGPLALHDLDNFIVEHVKETGYGEMWVVGS